MFLTNSYFEVLLCPGARSSVDGKLFFVLFCFVVSLALKDRCTDEDFMEDMVTGICVQKVQCMGNQLRQQMTSLTEVPCFSDNTRLLNTL
jgi:hypothetical protein